MNRKTQSTHLYRLECLLFHALLFLFILSTSPFQANAQSTHTGWGACSAQDLAKITSPADSGSDTADQICARYTAGSVVSAPPEFVSENGVLR
jgi:hypothetical protein